MEDLSAPCPQTPLSSLETVCGHPTSWCGSPDCFGTQDVGDGVLPNWYPHFTLPLYFCHHSWLVKPACEAKKAKQDRVPFTNRKWLLLTRNTVRVKLNAPEATAIYPWLFRNSACGLYHCFIHIVKRCWGTAWEQSSGLRNFIWT